MKMVYALSMVTRITHPFRRASIACPPQTVDKAALGFVSQSHFSLIIRIVYKIEILSGSPSSRSPHFAFSFASFLRFMQANVSPAFISLLVFPRIFDRTVAIFRKC